MSTYYYLVCEKHREIVDAAATSCGNVGPLAESEYALPDFMVYHCGCPLKVVTEHHEDACSGLLGWTRNNVEKLASRERCDE